MTITPTLLLDDNSTISGSTEYNFELIFTFYS